MSNAGRGDLVEPDTSNHCTAAGIRKALEKLESKKERQRYIGDTIDRMGLSDAAFGTLVYVSEYSFANKFYAEFIKSAKKALQLPGDASKMHELLDRLIHTGRTHSLKRMSKESLIDVAGLYVEIASRYHEGRCFMEMFQSLESFARVVSITKTFPERKCTVAYFRFLSEVFLSRCMFFAFLNALARLIMLSPHFRSQLSEGEFAEFFGKVLALARFKHEGDVFQKLFGGLAMLSVEEAAKIIERDMLYEQLVLERESRQRPVLGDEYVMWLELDSNWDAVLSMQQVSLNTDTIPFLSFLRKNNVEFALENGYMRIVGHCHRSMTREVFMLKQRFSRQPQAAASRGETAREKAFGKFLEQKRMYVKSAKSSKEEKRRVPAATRKDYFTKNYNMFRLYSREHVRHLVGQASLDDNYEKRKKNYDNSFRAFSQDERCVFDKLTSIKDSVLDAVRALDEKVERASQEQRRLAAEADERERLAKMQEESWRRPGGPLEHAPAHTDTPAPTAQSAGESTYVPPALDLSALSLGPNEEGAKTSHAPAAARSTSASSNKENTGIYQPPVAYGTKGWGGERADGARKTLHTRQRPSEDADGKKDDNTSWRT